MSGSCVLFNGVRFIDCITKCDFDFTYSCGSSYKYSNPEQFLGEIIKDF